MALLQISAFLLWLLYFLIADPLMSLITDLQQVNVIKIILLEMIMILKTYPVPRFRQAPSYSANYTNKMSKA